MGGSDGYLENYSCMISYALNPALLTPSSFSQPLNCPPLRHHSADIQPKYVHSSHTRIHSRGSFLSTRCYSAPNYALSASWYALRLRRGIRTCVFHANCLCLPPYIHTELLTCDVRNAFGPVTRLQIELPAASNKLSFSAPLGTVREDPNCVEKRARQHLAE